MSNEKLNEWLARELFGLKPRTIRVRGRNEPVNVWSANPYYADGQCTEGELRGYGVLSPCDYAGTYDGMGMVIEALHARKDTTYLIDMSSEWANGGKLVWRVNVCTPRNSYCWRDAYGPLWESLPLGVAESVKKAIELERARAALRTTNQQSGDGK